MDELELQGKIYISSKRAHDLTGYAKDYVGQLIRGGKVHGTRVGRSWYVDKNAILVHAGIIAESAQPRAQSINLEPKLVSGNAFDKTVSLNSLKGNIPGSRVFQTWNNITYLEDSGTIIPSTEKESREENRTNIVKSRIYRNNYTSLIQSTSKNQETISFDSVTKENPTTIIRINNSEQKVVSRQNTTHVQKRINGPTQSKLLLLSGSVVVTFFIFIIISSFVIEWSFNNSPFLASSESSLNIEFDVLLDYINFIFDEGIGYLKRFLSIIVESTAEFFDSGLGFIVEMLNLD